MILMRYGTDDYFTKEYWDDYYCKSIASAKRQLLKLVAADLNTETVAIEDYSKIKKRFEQWVLGKKKWSVWDLQISVWDLHIFIQEINLI